MDRIRIAFFFSLSVAASTVAAPVKLFDELPVSVSRFDSKTILLDYGKVAFGNLRFEFDSQEEQGVTVHFGESLEDGRIHRHPPGTVRYAAVEARLGGQDPSVVAPPPDSRNSTHPKAVRTPEEWGVVLPFRWLEIEGYEGDLSTGQWIRQSAFPSDWDDDVARFECSDSMLQRIWELCRYSIKATGFAGVYVDGDRERIPYEADAYLNQLSHYAAEGDVQMARDTFDLLIRQPTWPTEWAPHMVFMARADWEHTGDQVWLSERYESLKSKALLGRRNADGLVVSNAQQMRRDDIVDWPAGERDGYVFTETNTVVNAFHLKALDDLSLLAEACELKDDAETFSTLYEQSYVAFQNAFYDKERGLYRDGVGTQHVSLHANLFPLAFGLVPPERRKDITHWLAKRGMACSVYAAQYLLEGLFENDAGEAAIGLMTAANDRSWRHMVESGATITWEAWDMRYKPNQDWNHAWGAAPANLLPRYILGVQAETPGWSVARIRPYTGGLSHASGQVPTPYGSIEIAWSQSKRFQLELNVPEEIKAILELPGSENAQRFIVNGEPVKANYLAGFWHFEEPVKGNVIIEIAP